MKNLKLMKTVDLFLFKQLDSLSQNSDFQKIIDAYTSLEEKVQETIKVILMLLSILIPSLIFILFYSINSSKRYEVQLKEKLIKTANSLIQKKSALKQEERSVLGNKYIATQNDLKNIINSSLSIISVDSSKVQINDFDSQDLDGLITKVQANLAFKGFSSNDLIALFNSLNAKLKIKMDEVSIKKNESTNSLDGVINTHYYSKDNSTEEEE